jgi:hypothetical protein
MPTPSIIKHYQYSDSIDRRIWDSKYFFDNFPVDPVVSGITVPGSASGNAADANSLNSGSTVYRWYVIGTQTIVAPVLDASGFGLNLVQDVTAPGDVGDGIELGIGDPLYSPMAFTIGTDAAFFIQGNFKMQDASGTNPLIIGFRRAVAFDATLANYTDFATIGVVGVANPNTIQIQTQKNTAGVTTTDTTQTIADATEVQFKVSVSAAGVVTYQVNYAEPTVTAAFTFDDGDVVIPFLLFAQAADITTYASCNYLECGYQS